LRPNWPFAAIWPAGSKASLICFSRRPASYLGEHLAAAAFRAFADVGRPLHGRRALKGGKTGARASLKAN
jgi:hypothetical protein